MRKYVLELKALNSRLDSLVRERTAALRLVLDSTGDGFLPIGPTGQILQGWSSSIVDWYGPLQAPLPYVWDYLNLSASKEGAALNQAILQALEGERAKPKGGNTTEHSRSSDVRMRIEDGRQSARPYYRGHIDSSGHIGGTHCKQARSDS
jgi:hypothetical protein